MDKKVKGPRGKATLGTKRVIFPNLKISTLVVLKQGCPPRLPTPPRNTGQYLETFLDEGEGGTAIEWVEARVLLYTLQ